MTVASGVVKAGPFEGNASTTVFPFTFKCFQSSDLLVVHYDGSSVETELTEGVDYSVALNGNQETSPGGSVTYPLSGSPLAAGRFLTLVSNVAYTQGLDLILGGNWNPDSVEQALDRITLMAAQNKEASTRSLKVGIGTGITPEAFAADIEAQSDAAVASAAAAAVSEGNAGTSATNAGNSASAASTSATNASNSASAASTSATNASNSASAASTSATNAGNSATAAGTSATNAAASEAAAETALETFQGQYYGAAATDPTLDPNGNVPTEGDVYLNTGLGQLKFYTGGVWAAPVALITLGNAATQEYLQGSWTPVVRGTGTAGAHTYMSQIGRYVRIGNMAYLSATIVINPKDAAWTGTLRVTGCPFNGPPGGSPAGVSGDVISTGLVLGAGERLALTAPDSAVPAVIDLVATTDGASASHAHVPVSAVTGASLTLTFALWHRIAS